MLTDTILPNGERVTGTQLPAVVGAGRGAGAGGGALLANVMLPL